MAAWALAGLSNDTNPENKTTGINKIYYVYLLTSCKMLRYTLQLLIKKAANVIRF